jgi:tetratricopeptide (TPR) repeat protein
MLRGTSATVWYERGCAAEATDPVSARAAYERAIAGRRDFADAYNNLGRIEHEALAPANEDEAARRSRLARVESLYRLAICADPSIALYWFNLGVVVEDQGRIAEAIAAYEHALSLDARLADAHFNLARLYELVGRSRSDELVLRRAVRHLVRYRELVA